MNDSSPARASNSLESKRPFTSASEEFKIVRLRGAPYDMGCQHGRFLRHEIHYGIEHCAIKGTIEHFGWDCQAVDAFCASLVQGFPARVIEELRGIADGAEARWEDVLVWNLVDDYWDCCQCTAFAAHDLDCGTLYGRNNDWIDDGSSHISLLVSRVPDHGAASISATWAGQVGTYEGFSSHGLAIGCQLIVFELNRRVAHVAHGHLPSGHGAFVAVDLAEVFSQPYGMATVPYPPKAAAGPGPSITALAGSLS